MENFLWDIFYLQKIDCDFFFKEEKKRRCEKSLHYIREELWTLYRFDFKMLHVMGLFLWSVMLVQAKRESLPGNCWRIISAWSIMPLLLLHHQQISTSFPNSTLHREVFPAPGTREGEVKSCTVYTQCLNRGLYKEYLICLFLFPFLFKPVGFVDRCENVNIINIWRLTGHGETNWIILQDRSWFVLFCFWVGARMWNCGGDLHRIHEWVRKKSLC